MYGRLEGERTEGPSDVNGRSQGRERDQERLILKESEVSRAGSGVRVQIKCKVDTASVDDLEKYAKLFCCDRLASWGSLGDEMAINPCRTLGRQANNSFLPLPDEERKGPINIDDLSNAVYKFSF